ncbi:Pre-mRNA-splicing factor CWC25 [Phytophthora megakarya]|uniref:Pre-mRNA-splicing factor CWC25 n=1 Tax=Phytophthora megakarya TaxID=4795 RepID=A0A225WWQ8_9STRA|nr:Pre-mRNA-splicing factor CWC25 [Phytophthora megakarya]
MSLAFLAKKSWHTANLRNVEKVWIAEQKHAAEEKKVAELRKNIEEERQLQELRQLQAAQGNKAAAVERVDWMYEGPSAAREKTAEEYLLGKEYKGEDEKAKGDVDLSTTTKYGSLALTKTALPANDAFQRLNEDPMMLIRKRQQAAREQVLKNPVKMKRIKDEVDRLKEDKKSRKKAKKAAKKERKQARKEKRRLKKKKRGDDSNGSDMSEEEERKNADHRHKDKSSRHHPEHGRERERGRRESSRHERNGRHRAASRERTRDPADSGHHRKEPESRQKPLDTEGKYGLINKTGAIECTDVDKTSLGPNAKYLAKAREAKRREEDDRRRKLGTSARRESRELTDEEKKRMAQQMVEDAKERDEYIDKRATLKKAELDKREQEATSSNPEFLRKLHSEAYLDGDSNMSDRLRRNAHYIQRKADASNFLSK